MSVLVACFREAQPGRVAEVRRAVQAQAATIARQFSDVHTYEQFLIRNTWETTNALSAHQRWITHALFPLTDPWVARPELLALLLHWSYPQAPGSAGGAISAAR